MKENPSADARATKKSVGSLLFHEINLDSNNLWSFCGLSWILGWEYQGFFIPDQCQILFVENRNSLIASVEK